ncbi:MAG: hypothetical protein EOO38_20675 [Cytophagaceae bacterium]|nr:MAG: hypothetical protein EOO38_20675 [Cytophagaceae bacterium]
MSYSKHEIISCNRCSKPIECKANTYTQCQCSKVTLSISETEYISELYDGCLCADCLVALKNEYQKTDAPLTVPKE